MYSKILVDILGWTGSILYLVAYALISAKKTEGDSALYQGMNIFAGILLVIYTLYWVLSPQLGSMRFGLRSVY